MVALGVVDSVVVRAHTIEAWFPAGSRFSSRTHSDPEVRGSLLASTFGIIP
jgi:hypothetical protein